MGLSVFQKIIENHIFKREFGIEKISYGFPIKIKIDQILTHDIGGTMAFLEYEALGAPKLKDQLAVVYIDHNLIQNGFMNADDQRFLQTAAAKYGVYFSRPGNGICHQLHLERFAIPGKTLIGSDSHTPTSGALSMVAIGVGGVDVALAMAGEPFYFQKPHVVEVNIYGKLKPFVSAKDIILYLLQRLTVKGGINKVFEYTGPGLKQLDVPERATIANMGAELGATTSIFPSDEMTRQFMYQQRREKYWVSIQADPDTSYDEKIDIDLDQIEPLIAQPHQPDNVIKINEIAGKKVDQIAIGGCTNSSLKDLVKVALMLKGKTIHPEVSVALNPGSRQVVRELNKYGALDWLLDAGVRMLEVGCGPCIGAGFSPPSGGISLRTYNRNFQGRSGTKDAQIYLVSPESAAAASLTGKITDPRNLGMDPLHVEIDEPYSTDDSMIIPPAKDPEKVKIIKGPNITSISLKSPLREQIDAKVQLKVDDNISTDDILPAGSNILSLRSNLPKISQYTFQAIDPDFVGRIKKNKKGIIIAGVNYGQGSSREHAALSVRYLGIEAIVARSFSRIHRSNLINSGVLPLFFINGKDYNHLDKEDQLVIELNRLAHKKIQVRNVSKDTIFSVNHDLNSREKAIVKAGGILAYYKQKVKPKGGS